MTPEKIEELFHQAIELGPLQWGLFLDQACYGDEAAREELRSLLTYYEEADVLSVPAIEAFARQLARESSSPRAAQETVPGSAAKFALMPKQRLADRYEIEEGIGEGGMGQVYRAWDSQLRARVAIKVLPPDFSNRPDFADLRDRFRREAELLFSVQHENVCRLINIGTADGLDYLVMEYVEGETLRNRLKRPLSISEFMAIAEQCLEALAAVHEKVLHRDIKPENIMLDARGRVKLCDFGIARRLPEPDTTDWETRKRAT